MESAELTETDLRAWAGVLGRCALREGVFVALYGPLGAGKTTLVQAACQEAGVAGPVLSPSYTLVHRYATPGGPIFHVDLYRLSSSSELPEIGWDDLLLEDAPVFVEWAERAGTDLPSDRWDVRLAIVRKGEARRVEAEAVGAAPPVPGWVPGPASESRDAAGSESPLTPIPDATGTP
jgi:tRNA threonylcarbamoyladenosine biosynthesis protein TsaE